MHKHVSVFVPYLCSSFPCVAYFNCMLKYETGAEVSKIVLQENNITFLSKKSLQQGVPFGKIPGRDYIKANTKVH